jgi:hypothetical protein
MEGAELEGEDRAKKSIGFHFSFLPKLDFPVIVATKKEYPILISDIYDKLFSFYPVASLINL